jgi:tripartite-type tricarboxylate transporter receptor subunit TctC
MPLQFNLTSSRSGLRKGTSTDMHFPRRRFLGLAAVGAAFAAVAKIAWAQSYPVRPIHLMVGFPAGGPNDILARLMAQWLSERLGQPVLVENRPGASGNLATAAVVRAPADGYTLLLVGPANAINASLYDDLDFRFLQDIAPVAAITREPLVMLIHPSVPARTVPEFIAYAKGHLADIKMASTGQGSSPHVSGLLFNMMTGLDLAVVHYAGGGPALKALIEGQAQIMFEPMSASIEAVRSDKLRALAVTTAARSAALPEVPALGDFVRGFEASAVTGIGAPAGTPVEIIDRLNSEINAAFTDPTMKARLLDTGGAVLAGSPADFGRVMAAETEKWAKVIRAYSPKP